MSCRQNFQIECEELLNKQINLELYAFHVYFEMYAYFSKENVALHNVAKFFNKNAQEEIGHATKMMLYLVERGGTYFSNDIKYLENEITGLQDAFEKALVLELEVNSKLHKIIKLGEKHHDYNLCDYIETEFLDEQEKSQKALADHITNIKRCGTGLGEYMFNKNLSV